MKLIAQLAIFFTLSLLIQCYNDGAQAFSVKPKYLQANPINKQFNIANHRSKNAIIEIQPPCAFSRCISGALELSGGGDTELEGKRVLLREMIAEFIGTFLIVQIGCGTVCSAIFNSAQTGLWQIAVVWSIAVALAISTTASISGAHLNPAITLALALLRGFSWVKVFPFILAQLAGAVFAATMNIILFSESIAKFEAAKGIVRGSAESIASACAFGEYWSVSSWKIAFLAEAFGTGLLAFVVFSLTNPNNETTSKNSLLVPPLIGATVGALISVIAPLTQAGFNPARDFGPRIISLFGGWGKVAMKGWWVYVLAPLVGGPIGAFVADKVLYAEK